MADYVKVRQSFLDVPTDKGYVTQAFIAAENDNEIYNQAVAFNATSGVSDVAEFWVEVGSTLSRSVTYADAAGNVTPPFSDSSVVEDTFSGPAATGFGTVTEIDQRTADTRPTD